MTETKTTLLTKGTGYYDLTLYPIGGCFKRIQADTQVSLTRCYADEGLHNTHGCTHEGILPNGCKIALQVRFNDGLNN